MTPNIWSEADKAKMREAAVNHMDDVGYRKVWSVTIDEYGSDISDWVEAATPTPCGIETHEGKEVKGVLPETTFEITVRVPQDFFIEETDRFLITQFRGDPVEWEYELTTPIQHGISAARFRARKIVN